MDKVKFDYARVLIPTSSLKVVNCAKKLVVDGDIVDIKIVEEWGFNIGEDACLFEPDDGTHSSHSNHDDIGGEAEHNGVDTNFLVDKIVNELVDASKEVSQEPVIVGKVTSEDIYENVVQPISVTVDVAAPIVARTITCVP